MENAKVTIGRNVRVDIVGHAKQIPAKVDTGADSSSIWASHIHMLSDGTLSYTLFGKGSKFYDGKVIETQHYSVAVVRSSSGHEQVRYRTTLSLRVKGKRIKASFNLSDRSRNQYPVLIGRRTLTNKFIVDVTEADDEFGKTLEGETIALNEELNKNPYAFYKKYHGRDL